MYPPLDVAHNPGHTTSTLAIDVPEENLLFVGDTLVGNIVYLKYSTPDRFVTALENLKQRSSDRLISSHGDIRGRDSISNAQFYLARLEQRVGEVGFNDSILNTKLEALLPAGVEPVSFECVFHQRKLETVLERRLFAGHVAA
ncbi:MAG: hypothetical protein ABR501_04890 [Pyrinomonadaceae bacterium]